MLLTAAPNLLFVLGVPFIGLLLCVGLAYLVYRTWEQASRG